jgi:hypothetical protein
MSNKKVNIWVWIQNGRVIKAISCVEDGIIKIYDENDKLILKRTGLTRIQVKQIENNILRYGAKKLSQQTGPFRYL